MSADPRDRLVQLDSCAVADAADSLDLRAWVPGLFNVAGPARLVGRCVTVELGSPRGAASAKHLCTSAVESAGPGDVIVVAHQARTDCAGWGGNLSRAASRRGVEGTIVHGATRDVDESELIGYRLFATSSTPVTARGRTGERSWGRPIDVDGLTISTGDWVLADRSGVVFVPAGQLGAVLDRAEAIAAKEAAMAAAIDAGAPAGSVMGANYETMLEERS